MRRLSSFQGVLHAIRYGDPTSNVLRRGNVIYDNFCSIILKIKGALILFKYSYAIVADSWKKDNCLDALRVELGKNKNFNSTVYSTLCAPLHQKQVYSHKKIEKNYIFLFQAITDSHKKCVLLARFHFQETNEEKWKRHFINWSAYRLITMKVYEFIVTGHTFIAFRY